MLSTPIQTSGRVVSPKTLPRASTKILSASIGLRSGSQLAHVMALVLFGEQSAYSPCGFAMGWETRTCFTAQQTVIGKGLQ